MGYGISLSDDQWEEIERVRFSAGSSEVFRNRLIILYSHSRDTIEAIANRLGCSTDTVKRGRNCIGKAARRHFDRSSLPADPDAPRWNTWPRCAWRFKPTPWTWDTASAYGRPKGWRAAGQSHRHSAQRRSLA